MLDFTPSPQITTYAFRQHDRITIRGIAYRTIDRTDTGYVLVRLDGEGVAESFTHSEMARLVGAGCVVHEPDALLPETARRRLEVSTDMLAVLPASMHRRAMGREAVVQSFLDMEREGLVHRTDASIEAAVDAIVGRAARKLAKPSQFDLGPDDGDPIKVPEFSPRSLRRWVSAFEALGLAGLYDGVRNRGNRMPRLCPSSLSILATCVNGYMCASRPTQSKIYEDVKTAFDTENSIRREAGRPELVTPSKETVRQAILSLDPFHCDVTREGAAAARKKHAPVGTGLDLTYPLQRVELDTWKVDLLSLMAESGLLHFLSEEDKKTLGLNGQKGRWHLTVAMCATTRCILAMKLSRTPQAHVTVQTIDMIMRDKGVWSDAVGALSPWHMAGTPTLIVTDLGREYNSYDVRVVAQDLGITIQQAPGGLPEMRGRIERMFRTISGNLMQRLTGRTFGNIIERGDYDAGARAALTADDLSEALIRWVVDVYHRRPHAGLDGETPAKCWDRLVKEYGVAPPADLRRRRLAFSTRMTRALGKDGITILGVRYHSEVLAEKSLRLRDRELNVRWYNEDLGAIAVELDGKWIEVPAVFRRFNGVRAQTWLIARQELAARFRNEAALQENLVFDAIREIEKINGNAMRRMGLVADNWTSDRLQREDERLFIGFRIEPQAGRDQQQHLPSGFGEELAAMGFQTEPGAGEFAGLPMGEAVLPRADTDIGHTVDSDHTGDGSGAPGFQIEDK
jgi:putative transposase